jgi:hypothetical protein
MAQVPPAAMTAIEFMELGLEIGGHAKWRTYLHHTNIKRFKQAFGVIPETCVLLWDALRNSMDGEVRLKKKEKPKHLLVAIRFLWTYDTEYDLARFFGICEQTARTWWKFYVTKIEKLLDGKVRKQLLCS